jgi:hypothetical protein
MKKIIVIIITMFCLGTTDAQIVLVSGSQLVVSSSSTVTANGGIIATNATITNNGIIENKGNLTNNTSGLFASSSSGTIVFNGSSAQEITGTNDVNFYGTVEIDNTNGVSITSTSTGSDQTINGTLTFTNGLLTLNEFDLAIGTVDPSGAGSSKYIQTNSTGSLTRNVPADGNTNVIYPVGNSTYNPLILQNSASATADDYSVLVQDFEPKNAVGSNMVGRSWVVEEGTPDGSELTITPQWNASDELTDFDETNSAVGVTTDNGTTYNWKTYGAALGSNPYTQNGFTYNGAGTFAVADKNYVSDNTEVADIAVASSESDCFNAINTLFVANNESVLVANGAEATFVAGNLIVFNVGFNAEPGSAVDAHITTSSEYCTSLPAPMVANTDTDVEESADAEFLTDLTITEDDDFIRTYPNPTNGKLVVDFMGHPYLNAEVCLINFKGQQIQEVSIRDQNTIDLDLSYYPNGIYLVVIKTTEKVITRRVIKM